MAVALVPAQYLPLWTDAMPYPRTHLLHLVNIQTACKGTMFCPNLYSFLFLKMKGIEGT